jgi:peptide deformylase
MRVREIANALRAPDPAEFADLIEKISRFERKEYMEAVRSETDDLDVEAVERRLVALKEIRKTPFHFLRERTAEVMRFDKELQTLVDRMTSVMLDASGIGLAANQLGVAMRVFVCDLGDKGPMSFINPKLIRTSREVEIDEEGCLSLPLMIASVPRSVEVRIEAKDIWGKRFRMNLDGLQARCVQHEIDHLNGKLMIDHLQTGKGQLKIDASLADQVLQ